MITTIKEMENRSKLPVRRRSWRVAQQWRLWIVDRTCWGITWRCWATQNVINNYSNYLRQVINDNESSNNLSESTNLYFGEDGLYVGEVGLKE